MNEDMLERRLWRMEGWIDRWPWLSRYYLNVLQQRLGLTSPACLIAVAVLHVLLKGWEQLVTPIPVWTTQGVQRVNCTTRKGMLRIIQAIPSAKGAV